MEIDTRHVVLFVVIALLLAVTVMALNNAPALLAQYLNSTVVASQTGINLIEGTGINIVAVEDPGADRVDYTISNDGTATTTMEMFCPVTGVSGTGGVLGAFLDTYPVAQLRDFDDKGYAACSIPVDYVSLTTAEVIAVPIFTNGVSNYDLTVNYAADQETPTTHTATDTTSTYAATSDQFLTMDLSALLTSLAVGDNVGVEVRLANGGDDLDVLGVRITYGSTLAQAGGGATLELDLGNDDVLESAALTRITTIGDTNSVIDECVADEVCFDFTNAVPLADTATALAANGGDCSTNEKSTGVSDTGVAEGCTLIYQERHAVWAQAGDVSTSMAVGNIRVYADAAGVIKDARCSVGAAPTSSPVTVDVNKNGTTIFTTQGNRPSIAAGSNTDVSGVPDVTTYVAGDYFDIDIDAEDSGDTAEDLTCQLRTREASFEAG